MDREIARETARELIGADPVVAVTSDAFGLVIESQDIHLRTLRDFAQRSLFEARTLTTCPTFRIALDGDLVTIRFAYRDADNFDNSQQWRYYDQLRDILMGRRGARLSVANRIESWLEQVTNIRMQDIPLGRVAID